jgi:transposase
LTPVPHTHGPDNVPALGTTIAYTANRVGVAERFPAPAVQQRLDGDLALIDSDDPLLRDLELALVTPAKPHDANTLDWLQTVPGIGKRRRRVLVYERHDSTRFPRGQEVVSSCRVVTGAKASAGTRSGPSGTKSGNASLTWAFSEAAVLCLRHNPAGQTSLARVERNHGQGKAWTGSAHTRARAVSDLVTRGTACDMDQVLRGEGSGAGEPMAERGHQGSA